MIQIVFLTHVLSIAQILRAKLKINVIGQELLALLTIAIKTRIQLLVKLVPHVFGLDLNVTQIFVLHIQMIQHVLLIPRVNGMAQNVKSNALRENP